MVPEPICSAVPSVTTEELASVSSPFFQMYPGFHSFHLLQAIAPHSLLCHLSCLSSGSLDSVPASASCGSYNFAPLCSRSSRSHSHSLSMSSHQPLSFSSSLAFVLITCSVKMALSKLPFTLMSLSPVVSFQFLSSLAWPKHWTQLCMPPPPVYGLYGSPVPGKPGCSSQFWLQSWPTPGVSGIWGVNQQLSLSFPPVSGGTSANITSVLHSVVLHPFLPFLSFSVPSVLEWYQPVLWLDLQLIGSSIPVFFYQRSPFQDSHLCISCPLDISALLAKRCLECGTGRWRCPLASSRPSHLPAQSVGRLPCQLFRP
nr:uncharacterized protein LOC127492675 [Oryctolagus cuniculus]